MKTQLSVIVPVRNQAEQLIPFYYELIKFLPESHEIIWVNNASEDATDAEIEALSVQDNRMIGINLKKQSGTDAAVMAGLDYATGEYIIIMKGDMQHPPSMIAPILSALQNGFDIVNTSISNKKRVPLLTKWMMDGCYALLKKYHATELIEDLSELRGFKKNVVNDILFIKEKYFFPGNYFNWTSYRSTQLHYKSRNTDIENIQYTFSHLKKLSREVLQKGLPGFLKTGLVLGSVICIASLYFIFTFLYAFSKGNPVPPSALSLSALVFAGGLQIVVYSSYKKKIKEELFRLCSSHHYTIKNIIH
ncbi:MAG: glycosyltransferase [Bacteroidetes bacterium]|nr:glycosyltransferase [Bacteroidota bacterium]